MRRLNWLAIFVGGLTQFSLNDAFAPNTLTRRVSLSSSSSSNLFMGLFDSISSFLENREGDFVKLEDSEDLFGPLVLLMYNCPTGIDNDEIRDMIDDGAPKASGKGVTVTRVTLDMMEKSLEDALDLAVSKKDTVGGMIASDTDRSPVLLFSGFGNDEMMATYNIIGKEIYDETGGALSPACAKAVPNAMSKPLVQVIEEISGDHKDALALD